MKTPKFSTLLLAIIAGFFAVAAVIAQDGRPAVQIDPASKKTGAENPLAGMMKPKTASEEQNTVITSDRLFYDYKQKFALFQTNVVVVDPRIKITADQMTVFFDESNKVAAIKCESAGNNRVHISQEDKVASSTLATYEVKSGNITLTGGSPEVISGHDRMTGDPIIFNRDNNTVSVPGTTERPRLVIVPGDAGGPSDLLGGGKTNKNGKAGAEKHRGN